MPVYLAINSHVLQTSHEAHIVLLANLHSSKMPQIFFSVISNMSRLCRFYGIIEHIDNFLMLRLSVL